MITTEKDSEGRIIAYCEYQIVNKEGLQDEYGEYTFINDIWLHHTYRPKIFRRLMHKMVNNELTKYPLVKWIYFKRDKHGGRMKMYEIRRML